MLSILSCAYWPCMSSLERIGLPRWLCDKKICLKTRRWGFNPWGRKIPWRRKWQPTPIFMPGKSLRQGNLAGYSSCGCKRVGLNLATKHHHILSLEKYLFRCSIFLIGLFGFCCCYWVVWAISIFWLLSPSWLLFAIILSHHVNCLFILLMVSFIV